MPFNAQGVLPAGLHDYTFDKFVEDFVNAFELSQKRSGILDSLCRIMMILPKYNINPCEVWIDGSFVTHKVNPNDVDLVVYLPWQDINRANAINIDEVRADPNVDIYFAIAARGLESSTLSEVDKNIIINHVDYWSGQFGSDRDNVPKGIVRIQWKELLPIIMEGGEK